MVRLRAVKGKRWRKGQSCASNPSTKVHRDAALRGAIVRGGQTTKKSRLTVEAVAKHAQNQDEDGDVKIKEDEEFSMKSGQTFGAFSVSGLTDCSNPAFDTVRRFWDSPSAQHKEVCAVLAAVTEVIKSKDGKESETEYFAALMTALESAEEVEAITAIVFLLSLVIKSVPDGIIHSKFSKSCQVLVKILGDHASDGSPGLLRPLLVCLWRLLSVQEGAVWSESSTMTTYNGLLSFVVHSKPKVRRSAQEAVRLLLGKPPGNVKHHPACSSTVKYCVQQIEKHGGSSHGAATTLHVISVLKEILPCLPAQNVKTVCESLLKLMTLGNVMVTVNCLQAMHKLFSASPHDGTLSKQLNAQLINALYDYQPNVSDSNLSQAWISTMEKAYINLGRLEKVLCYRHLPRILSSLMSYHLSNNFPLVTAAKSTMQTLLQECLSPVAEEVCAEIAKAPDASDTPLQKLIRCMESGLQFRYQASWSAILEVVRVMFEVLDSVLFFLFANVNIVYEVSLLLPRLRCLSYIVRNLEDPGPFIRAIIPEVILCNKEVSVKARTSALTLLVECCNANLRSPYKTREESMTSFLELVAEGLVTWNEDNRRKFRYSVKVLFERLIRKFGYKTVFKCTPEKHQKMVHNTYKTTQRLRRQRRAARIEKELNEDEEGWKQETPKIESYEDLMFGEDEEDQIPGNDDKKGNMNRQAKERARAPKAWIREGNGDEPVDFLDAGVVQRVVASDPRKAAKRKVTNDFEISADGKLIIPDEDERQEPGDKRKRKQDIEAHFGEIDDMSPSNTKKRKTFDENVEDDVREGPPSKRDKNARRFGAEYKAKVCILWLMERTVNIPLERVFKSPFSVPAPGRILLHLGGNYVAHFSDNLSVQPLVCH
ncbi:PREDICTED: RRP12-like protein [Acropora digitifera]|uniref:RRP12-like protein n=1 Tax=Acropora digitifera TaxID=70779 RepID=UPI000779FB4B|nr:PREDICTED: RRP12-like protein [Acropora digitifera]